MLRYTRKPEEGWARKAAQITTACGKLLKTYGQSGFLIYIMKRMLSFDFDVVFCILATFMVNLFSAESGEHRSGGQRSRNAFEKYEKKKHQRLFENNRFLLEYRTIVVVAA